jgi:hypothetical protein
MSSGFCTAPIQVAPSLRVRPVSERCWSVYRRCPASTMGKSLRPWVPPLTDDSYAGRDRHNGVNNPLATGFVWFFFHFLPFPLSHLPLLSPSGLVSAAAPSIECRRCSYHAYNLPCCWDLPSRPGHRLRPRPFPRRRCPINPRLRPNRRRMRRLVPHPLLCRRTRRGR